MIFNKSLSSGILKVLVTLACTSVFNYGLAAGNGYTYRVPFDGDFDSAHSEAFNQMISALSNGSTDPSAIKVNVDSIISNETITDDGLLEVSFSDSAVRNLISSGKITVWSGLKEPLLVWLTRGTMVDYVDGEGAVDTKTEARIVVSGERDGFVDALIARGRLEKVNAILPLNDLDDMEAVTISDVMSGNADKISKASAKYTGGISVASLLAGNNGKLQLTYHFIDVATGQKIFSQTAEGTASEVVDQFYNDLKTSLGTKKSSGTEISSERGTERDVSAYLDGYSDTSGLKLGMTPNGNYLVLIKNTPDFDVMMDIKQNFLKAGFKDAEVVDVKGGDVVYSLSTVRNVNPEKLMTVFQALEPDEYAPGVFYFNSNVKNIIVIPDENKAKSTSSTGEGMQNADNNTHEETESSVNTATSSNENTETVVTGESNGSSPIQLNNRTQRGERGRRKSGNAYPDPNKKYKTGGGVL